MEGEGRGDDDEEEDCERGQFVGGKGLLKGLGGMKLGRMWRDCRVGLTENWKGERRGGGPWRGREVYAGPVGGMNGGDGGAAIRRRRRRRRPVAAAAAAAAKRQHDDI